VLLDEVAGFLTWNLHDFRAGAELAKLALNLNPNCSSELWNTFGDCLFAWDRMAEAKNAYLKAIQIKENDVRARVNLAWVFNHEKNYTNALSMIAEALALDLAGDYRDGLLQKQQEALRGITAKHRDDMLFASNRISTTVPCPGDNGVPTEKVAASSFKNGTDFCEIQKSKMRNSAF
jgi:tetratricopeptide (TPR) repeat protein